MVTTQTAPSTTLARLADPSSANRRLRLVLKGNAIFSFVTGLIGLIAAGSVAEQFGIADLVWLVRATAASLVGFAAFGAWISRSGDEMLRRAAMLISLSDLTWVAGTVAILLGGWLSTVGSVVLGVAGAAVADFALVQLWFRRLS